VVNVSGPPGRIQNALPSGTTPAPGILRPTPQTQLKGLFLNSFFHNSIVQMPSAFTFYSIVPFSREGSDVNRRTRFPPSYFESLLVVEPFHALPAQGLKPNLPSLNHELPFLTPLPSKSDPYGGIPCYGPPRNSPLSQTSTSPGTKEVPLG